VEGSQESAALKVALDKIQAILSIVNDGARSQEGIRNILDIQNNFTEKVNFVSPNRYLVREDALQMLIGGDSTKKSRRLLLFNDLILIVRTDWRGMSAWKLICR
jgi:hypothetical protein